MKLISEQARRALRAGGKQAAYHHRIGEMAAGLLGQQSQAIEFERQKLRQLQKQLIACRDTAIAGGAPQLSEQLSAISFRAGCALSVVQAKRSLVDLKTQAEGVKKNRQLVSQELARLEKKQEIINDRLRHDARLRRAVSDSIEDGDIEELAVFQSGGGR